MKVLAISAYVPYDTVSHAGGKTHNYYIKTLAKECELKLITCAERTDMDRIDLDQYGIDYTLLRFDATPAARIGRKLANGVKRFAFLGCTGGFYTPFFQGKVLRELKRLKKENYFPDRILLEWTQTVLLLPAIKRIYPHVTCIGSEVDVCFQSYWRYYRAQKNWLFRLIWHIRYRHLKKYELACSGLCDSIIVQSEKDKKILMEHAVPPSKVAVIAPYFDTYYGLERNNIDRKKIVFYGAMSRSENYLSAIWFIENVLPQLNDGYDFYVVGGNPHPCLRKYAANNIIITGFVKNAGDHFKDCLCMAAPLVLGAGIKVKILEAFTAGVPVLTNAIGIEGILAVNGKEYLHCESPEDYSESIRKLNCDKGLCGTIGANARKFVKEKFDYEKTYSILRKKIFEKETVV